jgi:hypothetical protein
MISWNQIRFAGVMTTLADIGIPSLYFQLKNQRKIFGICSGSQLKPFGLPVVNGKFKSGIKSKTTNR